MNSSAMGLIILAAGASTRMGTPKQLLLYQGRSFVRHAVEVALASVCQPIVVVLGANAQRIKPQINHLPIQIVENQQWSEGMSSSIRVGIKTLNAVNPDLEAVVIALCDQPFISSQIINQLIEAHCLTGKPIVASEYAGTLGVPALFSRALFSELMALKTTQGAKQTITKHLHEAVGVPFPDGALDIDTPLDYEQLQMMTEKTVNKEISS